jgi:hypothetical protein
VVNETLALPSWAIAVGEAIEERKKLKRRHLGGGGADPYVPPWAAEDDEAETNPHDLPQLKTKLFRGLAALYDSCRSCEWFVVADDDTYVRVPELLSALAQYSPVEILLIGSPNDSDPFTVRCTL